MYILHNMCNNIYKNDKVYIYLLIPVTFDPVQLKSATAEYKIAPSGTNAAFLIKREKVPQWDVKTKWKNFGTIKHILCVLLHHTGIFQ